MKSKICQKRAKAIIKSTQLLFIQEEKTEIVKPDSKMHKKEKRKTAVSKRNYQEGMEKGKLKQNKAKC